MALDLFCYCSQELALVESTRLKAAAVFRERFGDGLIAYEAKEAVDIHREIAGEFGLEATLWFLISVNDKQSLAPKLSDVVEILRDLFSEESIVVLLNNESAIR